MEPWCERTSTSPASSFSAPASRSASRRLFTKSSVDWCERISSSRRGWIADQMDGRVPLADAGPLGMSSSAAVVRRAMSSTGTSIRSDSFFFAPASTMVTGR